MNSLIDVNVSLFRYPTRRLPDDEPQKLIARLRQNQITQAWAGSYEALLHRDIDGVNRRLKETCDQHGKGILLPFGAVNPAIPDWKEDFRRCHEDYGFQGIRLYPTYHQYLLDDKRFIELLHMAEESEMVVQLVATVEDARTQHPLLSVSPIELKPLFEILSEVPRLKLVILNGFRDANFDSMIQLCRYPNVSVDFAMLEGFGSLRRLINTISAEQILFGSNAPFYYPDSSLLKMKEAKINPDEFKIIGVQNPQKLLTRSKPKD